MGKITFTNRTSEVKYEGELKDILKDLSKKENLRSAYLPSENMPDSDFEGAQLPFVTFSHSVLNNCNFKNAELRYAHFNGCDLRGCDFSGANLAYANFRLASVQGAKFTGAHMIGVSGLNHIPEDALEDELKVNNTPNINHWAPKKKG